MKFIFDVLRVLKAGIARFISPFIATLYLFILTCYNIFVDRPSSLVPQLAAAGVCALVTALLFQIVSERWAFEGPTIYAQRVLALAVGVPTYFFTHNIETSLYVPLAFGGIIFAELLVAIYLLISQTNEKTLISHIVKSGVFCGFLAQIVWGGFSILVAAVNFLIVKLPLFDRWPIAILAFAWIVLFVNLLLSYVPQRDQELVVPKAFKVASLYAAFPIYTALMVVLYVYLGKIIITQSMPSGQLNWFGSTAALLFVYFSFTLPQYDNKATNLFMRYGGLGMVPVMIMQAIAIYIRVNAYGLTTARWMSIVLFAVAVIFVCVSYFKRMHYIRHVILILVGAVLVTSIGPLNAVDVPVYEQSARLTRILTQNNMLKDGVVTPRKNLSKSVKIKITSCYDVISRAKKRPAYVKDQMVSFEKRFGFEPVYASYVDPISRSTFFNRSQQWSSVSVEGFKRYESITASARSSQTSKNIRIEVAGKDYDVTEQVLQIPKEGPQSQMSFKLDDSITIYISMLSYEKMGAGAYQYYSVEGFALVK